MTYGVTSIWVVRHTDIKVQADEFIVVVDIEALRAIPVMSPSRIG